MSLQQWRQDTPAVENLIHFNNAGASLSPQPVIDRYIQHIHEEQQIGGYEAAFKNMTEYESLYQNIAELINAQANEIAILESATKAWDMFFYSFPWQAGDRILTSVSEYSSNYIAFLQVAKKHQVVIDVVPYNEYGEICLKSLEEKISKDCKMIAITHMPTNNGLVNPAEAIGKIAQKHEIYYLLDACQSVGQYPIDVQKIACDALSATGRKYLRAPRGTGFLYVKESVCKKIEPIFLDTKAAEWDANQNFTIREDAIRFESWERNMAANLGLNQAVIYANSIGIENIWSMVQELANNLRKRLRDIDGVQVWDSGQLQSGIVCFTKAGIDSLDLQKILAAKKINTTASIIGSARLDFEYRNIENVLRASVHYYNTEAEIDAFIECIKSL